MGEAKFCYHWIQLQVYVLIKIMSAGHSVFGENEDDGVGATGETSSLTSFLTGLRAVAKHCGKNLDWGNSQTCHIPFNSIIQETATGRSLCSTE